MPKKIRKNHHISPGAPERKNEKMRNVGSVIITTSSGNVVSLYSIASPYELYKTINKVYMDVRSDIAYPNAYRPAQNPGYHTEYKG